jgi:hypothetical protein
MGQKPREQNATNVAERDKNCRDFKGGAIARLVRDVGVAGSNPATPTIFSAQNGLRGQIWGTKRSATVRQECPSRTLTAGSHSNPIEGHSARRLRITNLGVGSSNLSGSANKIKHLAGSSVSQYCGYVRAVSVGALEAARRFALRPDIECTRGGAVWPVQTRADPLLGRTANRLKLPISATLLRIRILWPRVADARPLSAQRCQGAALTPRISGYHNSLLAQKDQPPHSLRPPRLGRLVEHWAASNVEPHSHTMSRSIGCSRARCGDPASASNSGSTFSRPLYSRQPT